MLERFARRSLYTLNDLLFHLPSRYQDKTRVVPIAGLRSGDHALLKGKLTHCQVHHARQAVLSCTIEDENSVLSLRFFHFKKQQVVGLQKALQQGKWLSCFGEVKYGRHSLEIIHPEYRIINKDQPIQVAEALTPVYPSTEGLSQLLLRNTIHQVLEQLQEQQLADYLPPAIRHALKLPSLFQALNYLHSPSPDCSLFELVEGSDPYRQSLVFEELLAHQLSMKSAYQQQKQHISFPLKFPLQKLDAHDVRSPPQKLDAHDIKLPLPSRERAGVRVRVKVNYSLNFQNQLPFTLTHAQQKVIDEIRRDVQQSQPMQRLLQGDVGSGKTVVAAMAALFAIENNYQAALMAPTELLADQHRENFQQWLEPMGLKVGWLSGKCTARQRRESLQAIADGSVQMVIGTHALFQEQVVFKQLALVIIDEQHRFGVHQRLSLLQKGSDASTSCYPHQLIMTATPIPRTLAMTAYADLDCSIIDELPLGRIPVATVVLSEQRRDAVLERVHLACLSGRQAYWVCTLIEESEVLQCQAAEKTYAALQLQFPDLSIGLVHGRMKADEKKSVMQAFKQAEISLLVATTVIEVGVDVPNASLMIIENAERLGLSQLHQLRGRVGRGRQSSACVLMHGNPLSKNAKSRLTTLRKTNNGFEIARKDLALRGPGEVLGTRQTGLAEMKIADIIRDQHMIPAVNKIAQQLLSEYPQSVEAIINRWIGKKTDYQNV